MDGETVFLVLALILTVSAAAVIAAIIRWKK